MRACAPSWLRGLLVICTASAAWAFAFGIGTQAANLWLADAGLDKDTIGLNAGTYYLGMAVAGLAIPALVRRWGVGCIVVGMSLVALSVVLFPWVDAPVLWFLLRLLQGIGGALSLVPLEAQVSQVSLAQHRARNFAFYGVALTLAGAAGLDVGLHLYRPGTCLPFAVAGLSAVAGAVVALLMLPPVPVDNGSADKPMPLGLRRHFLSYGTALVQGFLEGGLLIFLPLYLLSLGLEQETAGNLLGAAMIGMILFQVPVGWLADRLGKVTVLLMCYGGVVLGLALLPACAPGAWLGAWLFVVGACSAALFPLGLSLLSEGLSGARLPQAYGRYLTLDCIGSVLGPVCMGQAWQWGGGPALFFCGVTAIALVLLLSAGLRLVGYNEAATRQRAGGRQQGTGIRVKEAENTMQESRSGASDEASAA
jgi:MFS family permease